VPHNSRIRYGSVGAVACVLILVGVLLLGSTAGAQTSATIDFADPSPMDDIFYGDAKLMNTAAAGGSLRFRGNGVRAPNQDRVKIRIDNPAVPADVGATDFTLEFWMKAIASENTAGALSCGADHNWIYGNIVFDRDRYNQDREFGLSIANGRFIFGVSGNGTGERTICGATSVLDNVWHHVAVQRRRSDGQMWLFVDGVLEAQAAGPGGDVSYPDNATPGNFCGPGGSGNGSQPCTNDPFLVIGAEKHDAGALYPSYSGFLDEVRLSSVLRYPTSGGFARPTEALCFRRQHAGALSLRRGSGQYDHRLVGRAGGSQQRRPQLRRLARRARVGNRYPVRQSAAGPSAIAAGATDFVLTASGSTSPAP
jgi:Concanavalin A-like lectin/glucanases superfamily